MKKSKRFRIVVSGLFLVLGVSMFIKSEEVDSVYAAAPTYEDEIENGDDIIYHIRSEEDYRRVVTERNRAGYRGVVIYLDDDIEFEKPVIPIGRLFAPFEGKFFGGGHTLSNVFFDWESLSCDGVAYGGVFGDISSAFGKKVEVLDLKVSAKPGEEIAFIGQVCFYCCEDYFGGEYVVEIRGCEIEEGSDLRGITGLNGIGMISVVDMGVYGKERLIIRDCVCSGKAYGEENTGVFIGMVDIGLRGNDDIIIEVVNNRYGGRIKGDNGTNIIGTLAVIKDRQSSGSVNILTKGCEGVIDKNIGRIFSNIDYKSVRSKY